MSQTPSTDVRDPDPGGGGPRGPFGRLGLFLRQVFDELRKVVVPTRRELINYTLVVLVFVIIVIGIVSALDWAISAGTELIFGGGSDVAPQDVAPEGDGGQ